MMNYTYSAPSPPNSIKEESDDIDTRLVLSLADSTSSYYSQPSPQPSSPSDSYRSSQSHSPCPESTQTEEEEKKPVKKRKSWGQQLPVPTTNLPPRKRAKTDAEKEQRRVERVLRNRLAAQTSRERKRKEMELLEERKMSVEKENQDLKSEVIKLRQDNQSLQLRLAEMEKSMADLRRFMVKPSNQTETYDLPATPESQLADTYTDNMFDDCFNLDNIVDGTLNPNDLTYDESPMDNYAAEEFSILSSTQHPAAVLCSHEDLQCLPRTGTTPPSQTGLDVIVLILAHFLMAAFQSLPETTKQLNLPEMSTHLTAWKNFLENWFNQAQSFERLIASSLPLAHLIMVATGLVSRNQFCERVSGFARTTSKEFSRALKADVFLGHHPTIMKSVDYGPSF